MVDVNCGNCLFLFYFMIYKFQLMFMFLIMVCIIGIVVLGVVLIVVVWFLVVVILVSVFFIVNGLFDSFIGDVILLGVIWLIFYYMLGCLCYVFWDFGYCFEVFIFEKLVIGMFVLVIILIVFVVLVIC